MACGRWMVVAALLAPTAWAEAPADHCSALAGLTLENAKVTAAHHVAPGFKLPFSLFSGKSGPNAVAKSSFCRVALTIETDINVEVWLPDVWNGRFQGVGNGGLTGALNYPAMATAVAAGFASASTDTGHSAKSPNDPSWIAGHPERLINFAFRGHHLMAVTAKQVVSAYYGKPATKAYFAGCSAGGWQGVTEAQRYPEDYDGIVAGAPAINIVKMAANEFVQARLSRLDPKGDLPRAKQTLLAKAMVTQCDAADGLRDGLIADPRLCRFDWSKVTCNAGDGPDCLTKPQVARAKKLYGPQKTAKGLTLYPGQPLGVEAIAPADELNGRDPFDTSLVVLALKHKPSWTTATFDPDRDIPPLEAALGADLDSLNPDLSAFKARGGKLILYHGWQDDLVSAYATIAYADAVKQKMPSSNDVLRLFLVPGLGHCRGGSGTPSFDHSAAIVNWVEHGIAPDAITAYRPEPDGTISMTRPICAAPKMPFYTGTGPASEASSFVCKAPK